MRPISTRLAGSGIALLLTFCFLFSSFSVQAQCWENFSVYQTYPYGQLCSPGYVTLRAEYYNEDPYTFVQGEFRWYTSETDPNPVHTAQVYSDFGSLYSDYTLYAQNGTTIWVSYYNYNTWCESPRQPYSFYISQPPSLYQNYAYKCSYDAAKVQVSSDVSGVTFQLYKYVEYYDPNWGWRQEYQYINGNSTGYFEIWDFNAADQYNYYVRVSQPYGCSSPYYYNLYFEVVGPEPPTISGITTLCPGQTTTLSASGNAADFRWYDAGGSLVHTGWQYTTPATLSASTSYQVRGISSDGSCQTDATTVNITVNPLPVDGSIRANTTSIYLGQSVTITSSGGVGTPHYWCSNDGANWNVFADSYVGQTSFQHTPSAVGTYRYHLRNQTACGFCWDQAGGCTTFPYVDVVVTAPPPTITYSPLFTSSNFTKTIDLSRPVGTVAGAAGTTPTGGVTYTMPIITPPGTNGMQPSVSIGYNSQAASGVVGYGWSIGGLSVVSRTGKNIYHNGIVAPVAYSSEDAFLLDGMRLNAISGANGASGTVYATESETYSRIVSQGGSSANPEWFQVTTKDGSIMEFGRTATSRVLTDDGGSVMLWRLNKIIDVSGNYIEFAYSVQDRESKIDEISFTGNQNTGLQPYNKIKFTYDLRTDATTLYEGGASLSSKHLLKNIEVSSEGSVVKKYGFTYGFDNVHSLLKEVVETGSDGATLNSTIFLYGDQPQNLLAQSTTALIGSYDFFAGDFDADGKTDLLAAESYYDQNIGGRLHSNYSLFKDISESSMAVLYTKSLPQGTSVNAQDQKYFNFLTADCNGDGRDDVLQVNSATEYFQCIGYRRKISGIMVNYTGSHNGSTGWTDYTQQNYATPTDRFGYLYEYASKNANFFIPGDFDGDGNQDYILILGKKREVGNCITRPLYTFDFKAFITSTFSGETNQEIANFGFGSGAGTEFYAGTVANADRIAVLDLNGDGKTEILVTKDGQSYVLSIQRVSVTSGYSFAASVLLTTAEVTKDSRTFAGDFNGDRKTDLLVRNSDGSFKILYSTGTSFKAQPFSFNQSVVLNGEYSDHKVIVSDFNGDGKSDIMHGYPNGSSASAFSLYYSRASGNANPFHYEQYFYGNILAYGEFVVGDFNGDGRSDLLNRFNVSSPADFISIKPYGQERLLKKVTDGHNVTTAFEYKLLTDKENYPYFHDRTVSLDGAPNAYPYNYVQFPILAVSALSVPDGVGGSNTTHFSYQDAVVHRSGKGFLGFKKVTAQNATTGITTLTESEINTQFAVPYTIKQVTSLNATGEVLGESSITNSFVNLSTGAFDKRYFQKVEKTLTIDHINGTAGETVNTYDNYGNITTTTTKIGAVSGTTVDPTETITTTTTYGLYNTPVPARPESVTVAKARSGMAAQSSTTQLTYTASGLVASQTEFAGLPKAVTTSYTYNAFGNLLTRTISATGLNNRLTSFTYDPKGRMVVIRQLSGAGGVQTESYTYDFKWGKPLTVVSSDCLTTSYEYDGWGRLKKTTLPTGSSITTSLNWDVQGEIVFFSMTDYPAGSPDTKAWFDKLGRETKKQTAGFNSQWLTQLTTYDTKGRVATQTNKYYSSEAPLTTTYTYDVYNRIKTISTQQSSVEHTYTKLGGGKMQVTTQNAIGQSSSKVSDATGKIVSSVDDGGQLEFVYDSRGNQTQVKHGSVVVLESSYDSYGRQTEQKDKNAGTITFNYDAYGQLIQQTDNSGHTYTMSYDELGRMITRQGPEGITTYEYYKDNTTGCSNNNIAKVTGFNGIIKEHTFDGFKRLQTEKVTVDGTAYITTYQYDNYGNLTKTIYPSGVEVNNMYDQNGGLVQVTGGDAGNPTTLFTATQVNGFGQYTGYTLGYGKASQNTYFYGLPQRFYTPGIQDLNLSFNQHNGTLVGRYDAIKSINENFQHDGLNRLTQTRINGIEQLQISYDQNGNMSLGNIVTKTDAGNYTYKSDKIHALAYITNPAGPLEPPTTISTNAQQIAYTPFHRTASIVEGGYQLEYTYGADYQRIKSILKQNNALIETKYYFGNYEKQLIGGVTRDIHYVNGGNGLCALIVREGGVNQFYFVYTDHLGSLLTVTDKNGGVVAEQNFDAWGRYRNPVNWQYSYTPSNPSWLYRGYTGHEHLSPFALINMNGRIYDPIQGRMLSPDNYVSAPYGTQGYNRYAYAMNNPLAYTDPDGNFPWLIVIAAAAFATGNTVAHAINGDIDNFWDGLKYFGQGAIAGAALGTGIGFGIGVPILGTVIKGAAWAYAGSTALSVASGLGQGIFTGDWSALGNAGKIFLGNFYLDENRSFFGGVWRGISRFSWELPQSTIGYGYTQLRNTFGSVDEVEFFGGATFAFRLNQAGPEWGVTMGNYINLRVNGTNTNILSDPLYMHEYGHTLQSQRWGILYPFTVMIPSGISALNLRPVPGFPGLTSHDIRSFEMAGNRYAARYFERFYGVDWTNFEPARGGTYPRRWP